MRLAPALRRLFVGASIVVLLAGCASAATSSPPATPVVTASPDATAAPDATGIPGTSAATPTASSVPTPGAGPSGSMATARGGHTAALLPDGRVLVAGGASSVGGEAVGAVVAAAELYDPTTETFVPTGSMAAPRSLATATVLRDGRVLVAGGGDIPRPGAVSTLATAELYDPTTGASVPTGLMAAPRSGATATLLTDGRVLLAGGADGPDSVTATAETYDPATGTFAPTGPMSTARSGNTAALLADGRVLVAGGIGPLASAETYDPATGAFVAIGPMSTARSGATATVLTDGRVLVAGGFDGSAYLASAETYDPKTGFFGPATP